MTKAHPLVRVALFPALLALVLAACQPAPGPAASPGAPGAPTAAATPSGPSGTLTIAMRGDIESTHPYLAYDIVAISFRNNVFDYLVDRDYDGKYVPGLAESWKADGTTVTFRLRKGVKFHNGDDFTAEDVKFSIEHFKDPELKSGNASLMKAVKEAKVVDPYTVELVLSQIDARLFDVLTHAVSILPAKYYKSVGLQGFISKPVGTGPFKFVSWVRDDKLTMEANEGYWAGSYKGKAAVKTLVFRPIPVPATRLAELRSGAVDLIQDLPPDQVETIQSAGFGVLDSKGLGYSWAFFNTTSEQGAILKDRRVRLAMSHAVDTATIIRTVLGGRAGQLAGGVSDQSEAYTPAVRPFSFDQAKAKQLLTEAGHPNGFTLQADISASALRAPAEAVIAQLGQVGIKVTLNPLPGDVFNDRWIKKQLSPLYFVTWSAFTHPAILDFVAGCKGFISSFCSTEAQAFLDQGSATLDQSAQVAAYSKAVEAYQKDPFALYLYTLNNLYGISKGVQGWRAHGAAVVLGTNAKKAS